MLEVQIVLGDRLVHKAVVSKNRITVGRSDENDVVLPDKFVSRLHCVIEKQDGKFILSDQSANGTYVDKTRVEKTIPLPLKCSIGIYPYVLNCTFHPDESTAPIETARGRFVALPSRPEAPSAATVQYYFGLLVGDSPAMQAVYTVIRKMADSTATVLIQGENGTGKELVAKAIHQSGNRRERPFIAINCAAIPDALIESELFGYEKGAFTGAAGSKKGRFEEADGGMILLDEIAELSPPAQAKLLRFLQDRTLTRLGGAKSLTVDVRVLAATNQDLEAAVRENRFRSDLYFRIRVVQIALPPLRERKEDLPLLIRHLLQKLAAEERLPGPPILTEPARTRLTAYDWPGNIRQLENVLYSAMVASQPPHPIEESHLDLQTGLYPAAASTPAAQPGGTGFDETAKQTLLSVMERFGWNTARAAEALKVSRGTIYYKLKKFKIKIKTRTRP
ncbi:MAG: sigma 54-interacting transcriptional regulator [Nitrospirae bacterium]|nr:sigma 54-interacting transcriptional regulator [Nitrospirota bacterium]